MQAWAFLPQVPRRKLRSTWYLAAPDRQALLEWAEVWSGVVWERDRMAQVLWREAYLKRQKRKGRDTRGRSRLRWNWLSRGTAPFTSCNIREGIGQPSRDNPGDESTDEPTLRM